MGSPPLAVILVALLVLPGVPRAQAFSLEAGGSQVPGAITRMTDPDEGLEMFGQGMTVLPAPNWATVPSATGRGDAVPIGHSHYLSGYEHYLFGQPNQDNR